MTPRPLDLQEQIARIDRDLGRIHRSRASDTQATWFQAAIAALAGLTSGAAIFAAGTAFMKLFD